MSFPGNYNIRYYKGDLYQFVIRPKTTAGDIYPVDSITYDAYFRISTSRDGLAIDTDEGSTAIGDNSITCEIRPDVGNSLTPGTTYYYDVSIQDKENANIVYTLLTGTISVTGDITTP
jgi:hypothetical protein